MLLCEEQLYMFGLATRVTPHLKCNRQVKTALVASMNARPASNNNRQSCLDATRCACYHEQALQDAACLLTLRTSRVQTTYKLITFVHVGSMVAHYLFLT